MISQHSAKGFSLISISNGVNYLSDPPPEPVSCHQSERCAGCPYPGHGFICCGCLVLVRCWAGSAGFEKPVRIGSAKIKNREVCYLPVYFAHWGVSAIKQNQLDLCQSS